MPTIRKYRFDADDIKYASREACGTFALALYDHLVARGVPAHIVALGSYPGIYGKIGRMSPSKWKDEYLNHVLVAVDTDLYDVRGHRRLDEVAEAFGSNGIALIERAALKKRMGKASQPLYFDKDFYQKVRDSLIRST